MHNDATLVSTLGEFKTASLEGVVELPGGLTGPPYTLDQADTTYLLTEDIISDGSALAITASGVTVDLNGHRIGYALAVPVASILLEIFQFIRDRLTADNALAAEEEMVTVVAEDTPGGDGSVAGGA